MIMYCFLVSCFSVKNFAGFHRLLIVLMGGFFFSGVSFLNAATMYSVKSQQFGTGVFFGPGTIEDTELFPVIIRNLAFNTPLNFITPMINNGSAEPNVCGELEINGTATGTLSDGVTKLNENVDVCAFEIEGMKILVGIIDDGAHHGQQVATMTEDGVMVMTMDTALDLGVGESGIIRIPFYASTGEVTIPISLQTKMGLPGGIDRAGSKPSGTVLKGRLGDFNKDGMLDGMIVLAGNIPIDSMLLPGAPYAFKRYFETNVRYDGAVYGSVKTDAFDENTNALNK